VHWESMLPSRVQLRVVDPLKDVNNNLVGDPPYKLGDIPNFHSLGPQAQQLGVGVGYLRGLVNSGRYPRVDELRNKFLALAKTIREGMNI
ncbi:MAG TPA: hypothetical protein VFQ43_12190, partial [Nitrososphaera sp.]|nr:hypothetical protein [Nitrososphaera sp.]